MLCQYLHQSYSALLYVGTSEFELAIAKKIRSGRRKYGRTREWPTSIIWANQLTSFITGRCCVHTNKISHRGTSRNKPRVATPYTKRVHMSDAAHVSLDAERPRSNSTDKCIVMLWLQIKYFICNLLQIKYLSRFGRRTRAYRAVDEYCFCIWKKCYTVARVNHTWNCVSHGCWLSLIFDKA